MPTVPNGPVISVRRKRREGREPHGWLTPLSDVHGALPGRQPGPCRPHRPCRGSAVTGQEEAVAFSPLPSTGLSARLSAVALLLSAGADAVDLPSAAAVTGAAAS